MVERRVLLFVFSISSILVLAGFAANEKVYAGGPTFPPFGDFECWENISNDSVPKAEFHITDQFNENDDPIVNEDWILGDYCAAATKNLDEGDGQSFLSPFESSLNQHYQFWFYPNPVPGPGTGFIVDLEIDQFQDLDDVTIGNLDSILVPANKTLPGDNHVESVDAFFHWNCYDLEFTNVLNPPDINDVELISQHGNHTVTVEEPFLLCAPMIKFDPFSEDAFGQLIDEHMVCYDIVQNDSPNFGQPFPVTLDDQLTPTNVDFTLGTEQVLCVPALKSFNIVGGSDVSINTSALLLAGVQSISMWMIPVVIAGVGIGIFVIKRRK